MAEENQTGDTGKETETTKEDSTTTESKETSKDTTGNDEAVKKLVQEALKPMKSNLDNAYAARDEALRKIAEFEQKEREAEIKRLQDENKHKEAFDLQLAQERAAREALEKRNVELTRDVELRSALNSIEFRNKNASEMAYKEIVSELVRNDSGNWVHKSGIGISEYVNSFIANDDNAFLLKQKVSTGTGSTATTTQPATGNEKKSLFKMSQAEVLKLAEEGKLPSR